MIALIDLDPTRGGLSLEEVHQQLIEGECSFEKWGFDSATTPTGQALYDHLFMEDPIEWNRVLKRPPQKRPP